MGNNFSKIAEEYHKKPAPRLEDIAKAMYEPVVYKINTPQDLYEFFTKNNEGWCKYIKDKLDSKQVEWRDVCDQFLQFTLKSIVEDKEKLDIVSSRLLKFEELSPPIYVDFGKGKVHLSQHLISVAHEFYPQEILDQFSQDIKAQRINLLTYQGSQICKKQIGDSELNSDNYLFIVESIFRDYTIHKKPPTKFDILNYFSLKTHYLCKSSSNHSSIKTIAKNHKSLSQLSKEHKKYLTDYNETAAAMHALPEENILEKADTFLVDLMGSSPSNDL